jgi:hypothetical protein
MQHRRGRPPLDATDPSTKVCVALPSRRYDLIYKRAASERVSVPEFIRRELIRRELDRHIRNPKSDERD